MHDTQCMTLIQCSLTMLESMMLLSSINFCHFHCHTPSLDQRSNLALGFSSQTPGTIAANKSDNSAAEQRRMKWTAIVVVIVLVALQYVCAGKRHLLHLHYISSVLIIFFNCTALHIFCLFSCCVII